MDREKVEYLCEIAYKIGYQNIESKMNRILNMRGKTCYYNNYLDFYEYVYDICNEQSTKDNVSLLQSIYNIIDSGLVFGMFDTFLSTYKK